MTDYKNSKMPTAKKQKAMAEKIMRQAINQAHLRLGFTKPNPSVCAIATDQNFNIIQVQTTADNGRPHAENILINNLFLLKTKPQKNSLYLFTTLEPCSHHGKTPPCADLIIECEFFKKVFVSLTDPDERVSGLGIKKLKDAGIEVVCNILSDKSAKELYQEYSFARTHKQPFITAKLAISLDGKIATSTNQSKWLSEQKTKKYTDSLRYLYDAILVGSNTYKADNPLLETKIDSLREFNPKKIVLTSNQHFTASDDFLTLCISDKNIQALQTNNKINANNLKQATQYLYANNEINHLLIEGGSEVITSFLQQNLINRLILVVCPLIIGGDGRNCVNSLNIKNLTQCNKLKLVSTKKIQNDIILTYQI